MLSDELDVLWARHVAWWPEDKYLRLVALFEQWEQTKRPYWNGIVERLDHLRSFILGQPMSYWE